MKKKTGFFQIDEISELQDTVNSSPAAKEAETPHYSSKKTVIIIAVISAFLITAFFIIRHYANSGNIKDSAYYPEEWLTNPVRDNVPELEFYEPDWDSDILNDEEYLELKKYIKYAPNDSVTYSVAEGDYLSRGGVELQFLADYINAVINGDHETINGMYSDDYLKKITLHSDFPQQRLYDIKIKKYPYKDPQYEDSYIKDSYYIISYKINKNDGLFRNDIGPDREIPQIFELLTYSDGTIKIDNIISIPGYFN